MSTLYFSSDQVRLAENLASLLQGRADPFVPATIVVPNRYLGRWLRLWLARRFGIAINLDFQYLETALWRMLRELDPRDQEVEPLDHEHLRILVLTVLSSQDSPDALNPFRGYLEGQASERRRHRRSWSLADQLARLLRDYQFHRHDTLIQDWQTNNATRIKPLAAAQRELFRLIFHGRDSLLSRLNEKRDTRLVTLPFYADEVKEAVRREPDSREVVYLFGISQVSTWHGRALRWLGRYYDFHLHHFNPLTAMFDADEEIDLDQAMCRRMRNALEEMRERGDEGDDLRGAWGRAGVESLSQALDLFEEPTSFRGILLPNRRLGVSASVLATLQTYIATGRMPEQRFSQDSSVQVVACPGILREVETVYQSILHNLQTTPDLKQTDMAVLVTDMALYRPSLRAVFDRSPRHVRYNLADFSASSLSLYGSGVLGLLELAESSFTRSRVLELLLNPCVLARLGVKREQASTWLDWAETLGIHHGWNEDDKKRRGYRSSPWYSWRHGLRRLRLGRIMELASEEITGPVPHFGTVLPHADLASGSKDLLDAFCGTLEQMMPWLMELSRRPRSGVEWAATLRELMSAFLAVPEDRPEEEEVRDQLLTALDQLSLLDEVGGVAGKSSPIPLALIREWVHEALETMPGTQGTYLTGGVTISALQPLRPVPFRVVYVLGLGEGRFPGSNRVATLDLRGTNRLPGDILPAETNTFLLLEVLHSTRDKVYLTYSNCDLQRDQELHACGTLNQLRRFLEINVLSEPMRLALIPLQGHDPRYLTEQEDSAMDVLHNYSHTDRLLAARDDSVRLSSRLRKELDQLMASRSPDFSMPGRESATTEVVTVGLRDLRYFLINPAEAAVRRHLGLSDEEEVEVRDDEPFYSEKLVDGTVVRRWLDRVVRESVDCGFDMDKATWRQRLRDVYNDMALRGRMPEGDFAEVDYQRLEQVAEAGFEGEEGFEPYLRERGSDSYVGPILIGEGHEPIGAHLRFPALKVADGHARIVGQFTHVWVSPTHIDMLVVTTSKCEAKRLSPPLIDPVLFYLSLRAGTEGKQPSSTWVGNRTLRVCLAPSKETVLLTYPSCSVEEARRYLEELTRAFLDRSAFDWIPLKIVTEEKALRQAYETNDAPVTDLQRRTFAEELHEAILEDQEKDIPIYWAMKVMELIPVSVPDDALDKVRRRYGVLDAGPAANRGSARRDSP